MFELSKDHEDFRAVVRDFATEAVEPHVAQWDRDHHFPADLVPRMGELGLFGLVVPEAYGGSLEDADGGAFTSLCIAIEELGRVDQSIGITLSAGVGLGINPILTYGTDAQKERFLPDLVAGRALAGFGLTEPDAGSDAGATRTKAVLENGEWVVDGSKAFITNSGTDITSVVTVTARTGTDADGRPEISAIMIPSGTPGSPSRRPTTSSAGTSRTPTGCPSPAAACPRRTCSGSGPRLPPVPQDPRRRPDRDQRAGPGPHHPHARGGHRLREDPHRLRAADRVNQGVAFPIADLLVMEENSRLLTYKAAWLKDEQEAGRRSVADVKQAAADGQALHLRGRRHRDPDRHAGVRRQRLHGGVPRGSLLPRRQDPRDR
jgi:short/branched chain acyl-CoA dehydrogenase